MLTCILLRQCGHRALEWCEHSRFRAFLLLLCCAAACLAKPPRGSFQASWLDSVTGRPIAGASVLYSSATSNLAGASASDASGYYYLPLLSPGFYRDPSDAPAYQSQEVQELESDRGRAHRARFPSAPAQRRLGIRPIQERLSPRTKDHRHVLWSGRRSQQIRIVRSAEGPHASRSNPPYRK